MFAVTLFVKKRENLNTCNFHNTCIAHALFARKLNHVKLKNFATQTFPVIR